MSNETFVFDGYVNPLAFPEVDEPWASAFKAELSLEHVVRFICTPDLSDDLAGLIARYKEISRESSRLLMAPAEPRIMTKLVWPLRHAKASYVLGNYLGTIALCGMVAEMLAILLFEVSGISLNEKTMEVSDEERLFGRKFEKLGQERRTKILRAFNLINADLESRFDLVRNLRNKYLHLYSQDHAELPVDAVKIYDTAVFLTVEILGQDIKDGKILLRPQLVKYLKERGVAKTSNEPTEK